MSPQEAISSGAVEKYHLEEILIYGYALDASNFSLLAD